jgi:ATPase subunit of ABC transporter with duplicated ATPase domains
LTLRAQRVRVAFARLAASRPHLLLLDEPTNHLDLHSCDALADALCRFGGGVVLISHNLSLLTSVVAEGDVYVVSAKTKGVRRIDGGMRHYIERLGRDSRL